MARVALVNLASLPMPGNEPIFPIGLRCVQEALQTAGHDAVIIDFVAEPQHVTDLSWARQGWDVIGFTIRNIDPIDLACEGHVGHYVAFLDRVRAALGHAGPDAEPFRTDPPLLVGGGSGYSLFADALLPLLGLDVGVVGPGEQVMLDIVADPQRYRGARQNLQGRPFRTFTSHALQYPADLAAAYLRDADAMIGVETRRKTCFQGCTYCPYAYINGQDAGDLKPPALVVEELRALHDQGLRRVFFTDSIFNAELRYAKDVVRAVTAANLQGLVWSAYFTPKPFDEEFAELLRGSGVEYVVVSPDSLHDPMMRALGKSFTMRQVERCVERCRRNGLQLRVNVVLGGPGESRESVEAGARWANQNLRDDELVLSVGYRVLPETHMAAQLGLSAPELVEPTFYPVDPDVFSWVMSSFDKRFFSTGSLLNLLAARRALRHMVPVTPTSSTGPAASSVARPEGREGLPLLAMSRAVGL